MTPSDPGWRGARVAELSWTDGVPRSTRFEDTYFSQAGGLAESRYVFLAGNDLPTRWATGNGFTIAETGFGTGLNFLATWQAWRESGAPGRLHYLSIEGFPLSREDMAAATQAELQPLGSALQAAYPPPLPGMHRLLFDDGSVCLDLLLLQLPAALEILIGLPDLAIDAWYLDGFAPSRNPEMWTAELFRSMSMLGGPGSTFATFTAAGDVRRGLAEAGFAIEKVSGFAGKREMLRGRLEHPLDRGRQAATPWHLPRHHYPVPDRVKPVRRAPDSALVLGAGLAGATVASALARRGVAVTVLEREAVAGAASGNEQGALYTRISHRASPLNDFSLHSFCFASRLYREMLNNGALVGGEDGALCGALHLRPAWGPADALFATVSSLPGLVRGIGADEVETVAGIACDGGLFYPDSGWMHPPAVCRALLKHPGISVRDNCGDLRLHPADSSWQAVDASGNILATAADAVVACGTGSAATAGANWLRLQTIRGQTSQLRSRGQLSRLSCVICHDGYLPPARDGEHCLGATFDIEDDDPQVRDADHVANLEQAARALPSLAPDLDPAAVARGRVGVRCASPDYLPIVGPVPDAAAFCEDYAALRRNARQVIASPGSYLPGLYLSTGHGSRGLTSTPLAAELLVTQMCGEPWPMPASLVRALSPGRFLVRELARNLR
jgi:tRNA 5-methylaminomethyl-2-thiouridine biosynthesis bifunctional protein